MLNLLGKAQGWTDSPLTEEGKQSALRIGDALADANLCAAYSSDSARAIRTARLAISSCGASGLQVIEDSRLREWCLGSLEASDNRELLESVAGWLECDADFSVLNERLPEVANAIYRHDTTGMAEPYHEITGRYQAALGKIVEDCKGHGDGFCALVVTHAFAIKTMLSMFSAEFLSSSTKIGNASILKLVHEKGKFKFEV